jgi:ADP-ribose pyrophosphatase YjhB (NUDIX family)
VPPILFCSACGAGLGSPPPTTCSSCGTSHWNNPKPCANAVVVEDDKVLLVRRAKAPWAGGWCTPGGFSEAGEHPIETIEREVLEETGLRVAVTGYIGVWVDGYADASNSPGTDFINVAYYTAVLLDDAPPAIDELEVSEIGWFAWDELPAELAPPGTLAAVLAAARQTTEIHDRPTTARTPPR